MNGPKEITFQPISWPILSIHMCGEPAAERGVTRRKSSRVPRAIHSLKSRTLTATMAPRNVWRCPGQRMNVLEVGQPKVREAQEFQFLDQRSTFGQLPQFLFILCLLTGPINTKEQGTGPVKKTKKKEIV